MERPRPAGGRPDGLPSIPLRSRCCRRGLRVLLSCLAVLLLWASPARADVWLPDIFGDDMVLQAEQPVSVWGKAGPGDPVRVRFVGRSGRALASARTRAAEDGRWSVELPAQPAGRKGRLVVLGPGSDDERSCENVLTGETWFCSGQSNMRWTVARSADARATIARADRPELRLFVVEPVAAGAPLDNLHGEWVVCTPESVAGFSGVAYHFGRALNERLDRPVGLVLSAWGGTPIQSWLPLEEIRSSKDLVHLWEDFQAYVAQPPGKRAKSRGTWIYGRRFQRAPARLYNAMVHPVAPFSVRGVVWYQGESNAREGRWGGPSLYRLMFPRLIRSWRERWGRPELPFLYVELAGFRAKQRDPVQSGLSWAAIRDAQAAALSLPGVHPVTAIDVGDIGNIHPGDKRTVGERLALAALGHVYGAVDGPSLSPRYAGHEIDGGVVRIRLHHAEGLRRDPVGPSGFAIRSEEGPWRWAQVRIEDGHLLVSHPGIAQPVAVRHAWADHPIITVRNAAGLPLMPFRTDAEPALPNR